MVGSYFSSLFVAITLLLQPINVYAYADHPAALLLLDSLTLSHDRPLQPSGLSICQNRLLMISDNQDFSIYELHPSNKENALSEFKKIIITAPDLPSSLPWRNTIQTKLGTLLSRKKFDWEGITCDQEGNIYLASEAYFNIAKITASGNTQWLMQNLYGLGRKAVFFHIHNAGIEGLAWQESNTLYIATERNQRGILQARLMENKWEVIGSHVVSDTRLSAFTQRPQDIAGLWLEGGYIFTLERNNFLVCRRTLSDFAIETCWNYRHIENSPDFRYRDTHFGIAEGLARQGDKLYVVVDNNEKSRFVNNSTKNKDTRAMLMIYKLPEDWLPSEPGESTAVDTQ